MVGMDRQAVRDGLHRYNAEGPEGLRDRPRGGTACFLDDGQLAVVRGWVESGPDVERDGVVRWRVRDIRRKIEEAFGVVYADESVRQLLRREGFRFGTAGAPAGLCAGAVGVPVRVPVACDGAVAFGVRGGRGVSPGRSVAPGRGPGRSKGHDVAPVGASWGTPARRPRPSLRLPLLVRGRVRGARQGGGAGVGAGGHVGDERAFGGHRRGHRAGKRWRRRARPGRMAPEAAAARRPPTSCSWHCRPIAPNSTRWRRCSNI